MKGDKKMKLKAFLKESEMEIYGLAAFMGKAAKEAVKVALVDEDKTDLTVDEELDVESFMTTPFWIYLTPAEIVDEEGILSGKSYNHAELGFNNDVIKKLVDHAYEALMKGNEFEDTSIEGTLTLGEINVDIQMSIIARSRVTVRTSGTQVKVTIDQGQRGTLTLLGSRDTKLVGVIKDPE